MGTALFVCVCDFPQYAIYCSNSGLDHALSHHCLGYLHETGNVRTGDEVVAKSIFLCRFGSAVMNIDHDGLELSVDLLR